MSWVLSIVGVLMGLFAFVEFGTAKTALQQVIACTFGISASVLFAAGCIISAIDAMARRIPAQPAPVSDGKVSELDVA